MSIIFEVKSETLTAGEAAALVAFLTSFYPEAAHVAAGEKIVQAPALPAAILPAGPGPVLDASGAANPNAIADALINAEANRVANLGQPAPFVPPAPAAAPSAPSAVATTGAIGATASHGAEDGGTWPRKLPNGVEVDSEGLPWDKRIHSDSKGVLKGGQWKVRRNTPDETVKAVKAELVAAMQAPPAVPMGAAAPAPAPAAPAPVAQAPAPAPAAQAPAPAPAPAATGATFQDLMGRVVDLTMAGVDNAQINAVCGQYGLSHPRDAHHRPDLIPALLAGLAALG